MKKDAKLIIDISTFIHHKYSEFCEDVTTYLSDKFINQPRKLTKYYLSVYNRVLTKCYEKNIDAKTSAKMLERYYILHILRPYKKEKAETNKVLRRMKKTEKKLKEISKDFVFRMPTE